MIRTLLIGAALFLVFALAFAPAGLIRNWVPDNADLELLESSGTIWNGSADLYVGSRSAGRIDWRFRPRALLQGALGYDLKLAGPEHALRGELRLGPGGGEAVIDGRASAAFANRWLSPYDILLSGELSAQALILRLPYDLSGPDAGTADGSLLWAGGPVRYRLSGRDHSSRLPPLVAHLGDGLEAVVYPQEGRTPLLRARMGENGFLWIGVTKMMTRLAGNPWPGSQPDHEVVLEVEEQLF